jgi:hypothetical protein
MMRAFEMLYSFLGYAIFFLSWLEMPLFSFKPMFYALKRYMGVFYQENQVHFLEKQKRSSV